MATADRPPPTVTGSRHAPGPGETDRHGDRVTPGRRGESSSRRGPAPGGSIRARGRPAPRTEWRRARRRGARWPGRPTPRHSEEPRRSGGRRERQLTDRFDHHAVGRRDARRAGGAGRARRTGSAPHRRGRLRSAASGTSRTTAMARAPHQRRAGEPNVTADIGCRRSSRPSNRMPRRGGPVDRVGDRPATSRRRWASGWSGWTCSPSRSLADRAGRPRGTRPTWPTTGSMVPAT